MLKLLTRIFLATFICLAVSNVSSGQMTSNQNGKVDRTFGAYGFAHMMPYQYGAAAVSESGIAFAASPMNSIPNTLAVSKQLPNGSFDTTFDQDGFSITTFPRYVEPKTIVIQADGRILIGGYINPSTGNGWDFFLVRYLSNGQLDTFFGSGGFVALNIIPDTNDPNDISYDTIGSIILNSDGTILVSGTSDQRLTSQNKTCVKAVLAKFRDNGSLEPSFGNGGISLITLHFNEGYTFGSSPLRLKSIRNGKFIGGLRLMKGQFGEPNHSEPAILVRYLEDSSIDTSFGVEGIVDLTAGSTSSLNWHLYDFTELLDQKLLVLTGGAINRLNADGSFDGTFGNNGRLNVANNNMSTFTVLGDGSIITSGSFFRNTPFGYRAAGELRKYFSDGSLDVRFGISGRVLIDSPGYDTFLGNSCQLSDSTITVIGHRTINNGQIFRSKVSIKRKL